MYSLIPAHRPPVSGVRESSANEERYYREFAPRPLRLTPVMPVAAIVCVVGFLVEFAFR